jgi:23S rRNA pseudouridine2605 synthase
MQERLQKIIARSGIASRRHAEELISSGQVRVNGEVVSELGSKADPETDRVEVAGKVAEIPSEPSYYMLHKPVHVVSTMSDPEGRATLRHLLRGLSEGIFPVGRLDYAASGLLLLTNDGELANRIFKNSSSMPKVYWIKVKGRPNEDLLANIRHTAHAHLRLLDAPGAAKKDADNPWYEVEMGEARRDMLRRALFAADHPVEKMKRVKVGPLDLGDLPEAHYRKLDPSEVSRLRQAVDRAEKAPHPVRPAGKRKDPGNRRFKRLREAPGLNRANLAGQASSAQPPSHRPFQKPFRKPFSKPFGKAGEGRPSPPPGNRPFRKPFSKPFGKPREGHPSPPPGDRPFRKPFSKPFDKSFRKPDAGGPSSGSPGGGKSFRKPFRKPFPKPGGDFQGRPSR